MKITLLIGLFFLISCNTNRNGVSIDDTKIDTSTIGTVTKVLTDEESFEDDNHDLIVSLESSTLRVFLKSNILFIVNVSAERTDTLKKITCNEDEYFDGYNFFHYNNNLFFKVQITQQGTGYYNFDYLFHVDTINCKLDSVEIEYASSYYQKYLEKGKGIWKGEGRQYRKDQISGGFYIYNDTDANCCPTGGSVKIKYIIEKINDNFKMHQDTCIYENP